MRRLSRTVTAAPFPWAVITACCLLFVLAVVQVPVAVAFRPLLSLPRTYPTTTTQTTTTYWSSTPTNNEDGTATTEVSWLSVWHEDDAVSFHDVVLEDHRTLGCTVEESLAESGLVFVSSVKELGNAEHCGLQAGDVIVQVSGFFGDLQPVLGKGLDLVKRLVASRPDDEPLVLQVARGTTVLEQHEAKLADLCANPDTSDEETELCVLEYLQGAYFDESKDMASQEDECNVMDPSEDCLLDAVLDLWATDVVVSAGPETPISSEPYSTDTKKPWSSRASPSGTFVRDPVTKEMRNLDV